MTSLATVSPQWDLVRCSVSHAACFRVRHKVPHMLVPAVRWTRSCMRDTFGTKMAVRMRARRMPRSIAGVDTRTKEGKQGQNNS